MKVKDIDYEISILDDDVDIPAFLETLPKEVEIPKDIKEEYYANYSDFCQEIADYITKIANFPVVSFRLLLSTNVKTDEDIRNEIQKAVNAGTTVNDIDDYLNELYDLGVIDDEHFLNKADYLSPILPEDMMDDYLSINEFQTKKR